MLYSTLSAFISMRTPSFVSAPRRRRLLGALVLASLAGVSTASADSRGGHDVLPAVWLDGEGHRLPGSLGIGDHLVLGVKQVDPNTTYEVRLEDETGGLVAKAKLFSDEEGRTDPALIWERSGVKGCDASGASVANGPYQFRDFDQAEATLDDRSFNLRLMNAATGHEVSSLSLNLERRTNPYFYFADGTGCLRRSLEHDENLYLAGENLSADASPYTFFLLEQGTVTDYGDALVDVRESFAQSAQVIHREAGTTAFFELLWVGGNTTEGDFLGVIRNSRNARPELLNDDWRIGPTGPDRLTPDGITISPWDCVDCPPDFDPDLGSDIEPHKDEDKNS